MIVSVCADKGSPGVTDLATVLGLVWPGAPVLLEADCAGADLPFRMRHADSDRLLDTQPSLLSLAADSRGPLPEGGLGRYSQPTTLGVRVMPGALSAEGFGPIAQLWPRIADVAATAAGTVIADLGRYQPGDMAAPIARASTTVLLLARPDLAGLYHLRDRVTELAASLGDPEHERHPVAVVVRARAGADGRAAVEQVRQVLEAAGTPVPVAGFFAEDPAAIALLREGVATRRLLGSDLVRSVQALTETVLGWWPQLLGDAGSAPAPQRALGSPAVPTAGTGRLAGLRKSFGRSKATQDLPGPVAARSEPGQVSG